LAGQGNVQPITKATKTIIHPKGSIIVDQFFFSFDIWSQFVPLTVSLMRETLTHLAIGSWWEPVVDPATIIKIRVDDETAEISLESVTPFWNHGVHLRRKILPLYSPSEGLT
jgi:hypothetical protein